ncbi:7218_t:CDS:2 [Funneliformis geosporum]|nr:7218_t:CDS:2 [Funneliformis geosporum]
MNKKRQQSRKTVEAESESTQQETRKASKKQKIVVEPVEPTRRSDRILRQESDLTRATNSLRISSASDSESHTAPAEQSSKTKNL